MIPLKKLLKGDYKNPGALYKFENAAKARKFFFDKKLQEQGYELIQGVKLNQKYAYQIMRCRTLEK